MKTLLITLTTLLFFTLSLDAQIYYVNSTDDTEDCECDDNPCTLRDALCLANNDGVQSYIYFDIDGCTTCTIALVDVPLAITEDSLVIDATTQQNNFPMDSRIIIDATNVAGTNVFEVQGAYYSEFYGLHITRNFGVTSAADVGIFVDGPFCTIGDVNRGNIIEHMNAQGVNIGAGNFDVSIQHNAIGTNFDKVMPPVLMHTGIFVDDICQNITIQNNIIAHNNVYGIENKSSGVEVSYNEICFNGDYGVYNVDVGQAFNLIKENSFYCNDLAGIELNGGNGGILPPNISLASPNRIEGVSDIFEVIEVYISEDDDCMGVACQGTTFLGRTLSDGSGNWVLNLPYAISAPAKITATATNSFNNTSQFAACVSISPDECAGAAKLPMNSEACGRISVSADLNIATGSTPPPTGTCSGTYVSNDVWFEVTVPSTGNFLVRQHASTTINASIEAYSDCTATSPIQCQEIHELPNAMVFEGETAGTTIYLRVWDQGNGIVAGIGPAMVELSAHILAPSSNKDQWELCDFPIAQGAPNGSAFGGGRKKANEFIIKYRPDATTADILAIEQQLMAMGAMKKDECACTSPRLQLWGESDPVRMEECKNAAAKSKSRVDTVNYNYIVEDIVCEEIVAIPTNYSESFEGIEINMITAPNSLIYEFQDTSVTGEVVGYYEYDFAGQWLGGSVMGNINGYPYTATVINIDASVTPNTADLVGTVYDIGGNPIGTLMGNVFDYIIDNSYTDIAIQTTITEYSTATCSGQGTPFPFVSYSPSSPTNKVVVAISDTGLDAVHTEFSNALWTNPAPGGCVSGDTNGYDFFNDTGAVEDIDGHGTSVGGIVVNNFPSTLKLDLMNLKFYQEGEGTVFDGVCTAYYAVDKGAEVLNLSWGFEASEFPQILYDALEYANCNDLFIATSAGNRKRNNDNINKYPANFELSNLVTVASYDDFSSSIALSSYSNYGKTKVDIAAPGYATSVSLGGGTDLVAGTSISAPFVARAAAILRGDFPTLSAFDIKECLLSTANFSNALVDSIASKGILDFAAAYNCAGAKQAAIFNCPNIDLEPAVIHEICSGVNGKIDLRIFGGTPPYSVQWSNEATSEDLLLIPAGCYQVIVTDANGCTSSMSIDVENNCGVRVAPKVFLQGPYNTGTGLMNINLNASGLVPYYEPYGTGKGEFLNLYLTPPFNDQIVDWVIVELRDAVNPGTIRSTRAALLQRDGDVVDTDGFSAVLFGDVPVDSYYVVVRHRNHLGVMSNIPYTLAR